MGIFRSSTADPLRADQSPVAAAPTDSARQSVSELEAQRVERGYRPGWLYYQCKEKGLLEELYRAYEAGDVTVPYAYRRIKESQRNSIDDAKAGDHQPKLIIELVPATCWFCNVRSEVTTEDWEKIKKRTFRKAGYRCQICGGRGPVWPVECHEIWEYDLTAKVQRLRCFVALCPSCHEVKHIGLAEERGRADIAMDHLAQVNGWSYREAEQHADQAFALWNQRSAIQWTLDLSVLEQYEVRIISKGSKHSPNKPSMLRRFFRLTGLLR